MVQVHTTEGKLAISLGFGKETLGIFRLSDCVGQIVLYKTDKASDTSSRQPLITAHTQDWPTIGLDPAPRAGGLITAERSPPQPPSQMRRGLERGRREGKR